jgi:DNA-binding MarR family transcriptional regulator
MPTPLGYALKRAQHALRVAMDDALRPLGLTAPQYSTLAAIELEPGLSNAELARLSFVTAQTMQGIVANLERDGLFRREEDPAHGRILRGELTKRGRDVLAKAHKLAARVEAEMAGDMSRSEIARLADALALCADNLAAAKAV